MGSLQIDVLGASFAIKANEESAYLEKLLGYYKRITEEIKKTGGLSKPVEIAIMSGITLVDELYKEKSKNAKRKTGPRLSLRPHERQQEQMKTKAIHNIKAAEALIDKAEEGYYTASIHHVYYAVFQTPGGGIDY